MAGVAVGAHAVATIVNGVAAISMSFKSGQEAHHVQRHADGGKTTQDNHAVVCEECHKEIDDGK